MEARHKVTNLFFFCQCCSKFCDGQSANLILLTVKRSVSDTSFVLDFDGNTSMKNFLLSYEKYSVTSNPLVLR